MALPIKPKKQADMSAMDALMDSQGVEDAGAEPAAEQAEDVKPKGDPATLIATIQSELDELSQLLAG
jgi:hypothetical protein